MSRIDCFTKHAPELEKQFKKMVDDGMPEMEAAKKLVDEKALAVSKELNDFKKSIDPTGKKIKRSDYTPTDVSKEVEAKKSEYQKQIDEIKNAQLDAIRDDKQKEQIKDLIKRAPNVDADKIAEAISKKFNTPIEEVAKLVEDVRGAEPPKPPIEEISSEDEKKPPKGNKAFATRLSENKGLPEEARSLIKEQGLKYDPKSREVAAKLAKAILDEDGIDNAVLRARAGDFAEDVNTLVQTTALSRLADMAEKAEKSGNKAERIEYSKKSAEIAIELDKSLRGKGQGISAVDWFYKKDPLGMQMVENVKRKEAFNEWSKPKEKSWKEFFDEMVKEPEFEAIIKEQVKEGMKKERAESRKERIKKVDDFFDKAKDQFKNGATYSTIIPPKVITSALEGMKQAYHAGEKVAKVIEDAIDYISNELGNASWDKEKFRKEWEEKLRDNNEKKPLTDEQLKSKLLDKFRNKLKGLSDKQKEEVVIRSHKKIIEAGGLDFPEFRKIISDVTGKGEMTEIEASKFRELVAKTNAVDAAGELARTERTQESRKAYKEAEIAASVAAKELNRIFYNRPNITKRLTSLMQLNTLGIPALVNNPIYNIWNQTTLRLPIGVVESGIERVIQGGAKLMGKKYIPETDLFSMKVQKEFFSKLGLGTKEALIQFGTGLDRADYLQKEVHGQQIRPLSAIRDLWNFSQGNKTLTKSEVADRLIQASPLGINAEIVARVLNLGDKPQRFGAEGAKAAAFAKGLGLKDIDYDLFVDFPREEAYRVYKSKGLSDTEAGVKADYIKDTILKSGERSTFQQDNMLNDLMSKIFGGKDSGLGGLLKSVTISPYIKIPSNAYWSYFNIVNPEVAVLQSMVYGAKAIAKSKGAKFSFDKFNSTAAKDINEAKYWFAHAAVGMATRVVVGSMVAAGIYKSSNTQDDSKKEREGEQNYEQQGTVNVTKLAAWLRGEDPKDVEGGLSVMNKWFGHWGTVGNTIAHRIENMTPEQKENEDTYWNMVLGNMHESGLKELEQGIFANSSSLISALNSQGGEGLKWWGLNTMNMFANIVHPATIAQISRAELPYYSKVKADSFGQEIKNSMLQRSSVLRSLLDEYPPSKVGIWGDKLEKKDNVAMRLFGFSNTNKDNFAQPIYEDYKRTGDTKFFPPSVSPVITQNKNKVTLNSKQTEDYEIMVGQKRQQLIAPFVNEMATINIQGEEFKYSQLSDKKKVEHLNKLYDEAREMATHDFKKKYSDLFNKKN